MGCNQSKTKGSVVWGQLSVCLEHAKVSTGLKSHDGKQSTIVRQQLQHIPDRARELCSMQVHATQQQLLTNKAAVLISRWLA